MIRRYFIYRGDSLIGYVGDDDLSPGEPFEPTQEFAKVEHLFAEDHEMAERADQCLSEGKQEEADEWMVKGEEKIEAIVAPGVRFHCLDDSFAFDCSMLTIIDGRVCWR